MVFTGLHWYDLLVVVMLVALVLAIWVVVYTVQRAARTARQDRLPDESGR